MLFALMSLLSPIFGEATVDSAAKSGPLRLHTVVVKVRNESSCYLKEDATRIILGNSQAEFTFDKWKGGRLREIVDKRAVSLKLHRGGESLTGEWVVELDGAPSFSSSSAEYLSGECICANGRADLTLRAESPQARLNQTYSLKENASCLICQAEYHNLSSSRTYLKQYQYSLGNLALGESLTNNRFIYPPTVFHFMEGELENATPDYMGKRYIYGNMQQTTKMMLPYAMIYNDRLKECITIAGVNSRSVVRVGVFGGKAGLLKSSFDIHKMIAPGAVENLGIAYLALHRGSQEQGMVNTRNLLMKEAGYRSPSTAPRFMKDLVILWEGPPGVGINTFDDIGNELPRLKAVGITALIIGGRIWFCPWSLKPGTDFVAIYQDGCYVPDAESGGLEGLKRLVRKAHSLGMRIFVWGPTFAGTHQYPREGNTWRPPEDVTKHPDWWIYDRDGKFNKWYPDYIPADPGSPGWREFFFNNVKKFARDYGVDGLWLDSSWQDHQLNFKAEDGWFGRTNGAKLSLISEAVGAVKAITPEFVVMSEGAGAEALSCVDAAYVDAFGIWPAIKAEEMQKLVLVQELNRIPGVRPFGQVCRGLGFYADMIGESRRQAEKYVDSWKAKTFLVSTLDRVPIYFGLNWIIGSVLRGDKTPIPEAEAREWFDSFTRINKIRAEYPEVREGQTLFDCLEVSSASIVHYLRHLPNQDAVILVNADVQPHSFITRIIRPQLLRIAANRKYRIVNLMTGQPIRKANQTIEWKGAEILKEGIALSLKSYEGAALKIMQEGKR